MGVADRLSSPATGNGDAGIPIAPGVEARSDKTGLYSTGVNPADTKNAIRPSADVDYNADQLLRDVRSLGGNDTGRVVFVNSDAAGADTFTLSFVCDLDVLGSSTVAGTYDLDGVFTTGALNDDDTAATIQTAVRAALPGTDLTVIEGPGPDFYIIFDRKFWSRRYPRVIFNGTGCTATVTAVDEDTQEELGAVLTAARDGEISALGESHQVSASDPILRPTIGTITVTGGTDKVDTLSFSAGTDGGSYELSNSRQHRVFDWDDDVTVVKAQVREMFATQPGSVVGDAPTVRWATPLSLEVQFVDWDTTDSAILTYNTTDASDALLFATLTAPSTAAAREAIIEAWVKTIDAFASADIKATEVTEDQEYDVVFHTSPQTVIANTDFALAVTGTTNEDATPDSNQAFNREAGIQFTYENGVNAGRASVQRVVVSADTLEDGGVLEPATLTATTAGVLGSASAAYTENSSGDSVIGAAVNDVTGESVGFVVDAATPVVFTGLVPGAYHAVLRTVEDGRVSKAHSKAFTVTST